MIALAMCNALWGSFAISSNNTDRWSRLHGISLILYVPSRCITSSCLNNWCPYFKVPAWFFLLALAILLDIPASWWSSASRSFSTLSLPPWLLYESYIFRDTFERQWDWNAATAPTWRFLHSALNPPRSLSSSVWSTSFCSFNKLMHRIFQCNCWSMYM